VTYHGPGQLVGYPIVTLPEWRDGMRDAVAYVRLLEDVLIGALAGFGIDAHREPRYTGVWVGEAKIAAIGVKVSRGRTRHGVALAGKVSGDAPVRLLGRLAEAGVQESVDGPGARRPEWMRVKADLGANYRETKRLVQQLDLHTVCEEAGCPNIYECWADHTA